MDGAKPGFEPLAAERRQGSLPLEHDHVQGTVV